MAGTLAGARAAVKSHVNLLTISTPVAETLICHDLPPDTLQRRYPYAYLVPPPRRIEREPGGLRITHADSFEVVVALAPVGATGRKKLAERYESWVDALIDAFDDALTLDGSADFMASQSFTTVSAIDLEGGYAWGFVMTLGIGLSEAVTYEG